MLLLFFPLFVANVIAACLPVTQYPPWGRRTLLFVNALAVSVFVAESFRPPSYSEWGMVDGSLYFRMAALLLVLSSLPVAWRSFHRSKNLCLPLVLSLLLSPATALAKRAPAPVVEPVVCQGVRYAVPNDKGTVGYVEAWDVASGKMLWKKTIFRKCICPLIEHDVQWVFIKRMWCENGRLILVTERYKTYALDLETRRVRKIAMKSDPTHSEPSAGTGAL